MSHLICFTHTTLRTWLQLLPHTRQKYNAILCSFCIEAVTTLMFKYNTLINIETHVHVFMCVCTYIYIHTSPPVIIQAHIVSPTQTGSTEAHAVQLEV